MVELPKNLKPKTKILIVELPNFLMAFGFAIILGLIINNSNLNEELKTIIYILIGILFICLLFYKVDNRNFLQMLKDTISYVVNNKYTIYKYKKVLKDGSKIIRKKEEKTEHEKKKEILKKFKIDDIDFEKGIIHSKGGITSSEEYYTFLEIKINKHPNFETITQGASSIRDFNKLTLELSKDGGKIFTLNKGIKTPEYVKEIEKFKHLGEYYRLKKNQIKLSNNYFNLRYFIELRDINKEQLILKAKTLREEFNLNLKISNINLKTFKEILDEKMNNYDVDIKSDYVINKSNGLYETYISLNAFEVQQNLYYLRDLFSSNYDISMMFRKPKDFSDNKTLNSAHADIETDKKYDKRLTSQIDRSIHENQLIKITSEIKRNSGKLLAVDIIIKVYAKDLKTLKERKKKVKLAFKGSIKFCNNTFTQKEKLINFHKLGVNIKDTYIIPDAYLAESYPFAFVKFVQEEGLLKNFDRNNLLILDYQKKSKIQKSFGFIIFGDKGSGKSTCIKEKALDDIYFYNSNVIMIDFDSETQTMVKNFDGSYIDLAGMPINILRVNVDPTSKLNISNHIKLVADCIGVLYGELDKVVFRRLLKELYDKFDIIESRLYSVSRYPTIEDFISMLIEDENPSIEIQKIIDILTDMDMIYPHLTKIDEGFVFDNKLMSISFHNIKSDADLTNVMLFYFMKLIESRLSLNHFYTKLYPNDEESFKQYLKYYMKMVNDENYEKIKDYSREQIGQYFKLNSKMFSLIVDECSKVFEFQMIVNIILSMVRDDRKYKVSVTLADQTTHSLETNKDFLKVYSLMQYKIYFSLEETNKSFLKKLNFLEKEISDITSDVFKPGEGIIKIGSKNTYKYYSPITNEIDELFEGRH